MADFDDHWSVLVGSKVLHVAGGGSPLGSIRMKHKSITGEETILCRCQICSLFAFCVISIAAPCHVLVIETANIYCHVG